MTPLQTVDKVEYSIPPRRKSTWELEKEGFGAYNQKDMAKAAQIFSEALTPKHGEPSKEVAKANALLKAGEVNRAAKLFRKIAWKNTHPRTLPSYVGFGGYNDYSMPLQPYYNIRNGVPYF